MWNFFKGVLKFLGAVIIVVITFSVLHTGSHQMMKDKVFKHKMMKDMSQTKQRQHGLKDRVNKNTANRSKLKHGMSEHHLHSSEGVIVWQKGKDVAQVEVNPEVVVEEE